MSVSGRVSVSASVVVACHLFRRLSSSIYRRLRLSFIVSVSICHRIIICRRLSEAFVFAAVRFLGSGHGSPRQRHHEPSDAHWHRRVVRKETPEDDRREMTTNNDEGYLADNERRLQRRHAQRRRHSTSRTDRGECASAPHSLSQAVAQDLSSLEECFTTEVGRRTWSTLRSRQNIGGVIAVCRVALVARVCVQVSSRHRMCRNERTSQVQAKFIFHHDPVQHAIEICTCSGDVSSFAPIASRPPSQTVAQLHPH